MKTAAYPYAARAPLICSMDISADTLALAGLIVALFAWLRYDIKTQVQRLDARLDALAARVDDLGFRVARIEGMLQVLLNSRTLTPLPDTDTPRTGTDN